MKASSLARLAVCWFLVGRMGAQADPPVPANLLDPQSAVQAWNVIRLSTANVARLVAEKRLDEVAVQISFCGPALRALERFIQTPAPGISAQNPTAGALAKVNSVANASLAKNLAATEEAFRKLQEALQELGRHFDPKTVAADVFFCPMHPDFISEKVGTTCPKCGMTLLSRRIPYSFVYMKPGEPTIRMTAEADGPIVAGRKTKVAVRFTRPGNGSPQTPPLPSWMCGGGVGPVVSKDLMEMHTQPIHLLIEEPGLTDYHHEHPMPTGTPGEYQFSFTPGKSTPYRLWADIVPVATGIQEMPFVDLPSAGTADSIADKAGVTTSTVDGFTFDLTLANGSPVQLIANQTARLGVTITDREGKPVTNLEPLMNAFAHLVGFYDDFQTVVHLHPAGGDILNQELRGGPSLAFQFFPPKPGFIRLYCQVVVNGKMLFAPFSVNVLPQP